MAKKSLSFEPNAASRPVSLRVEDDVRALIDQAAQIRGQTRADFMITAAKRAAEETVLDEALAHAGLGAENGFILLHDQQVAADGGPSDDTYAFATGPARVITEEEAERLFSN
jgi:uncharacterized protein (DUF1778 family)